MPRTFIPSNSNGWVCAQRRPLRALSHVLLLYDPMYILLADDDTFVSKDILFGSEFKNFVHRRLSKENNFVSKLHLGDADITRNGFYWGGSGYLIGKSPLDRLNAFELPGPISQTGYWTGDQHRTRKLSLLYEAMDMDAAHCKKSCFKLPPHARVGDLGLVAKTKLRLVDMCKNILSDEDTCYHSDHAISRCFAQAVYANFSENVKCWKREKFSNPVPFLQCVTNICMNPAKVTHVIPASI